jgi:PAS domain S-box-containing protein
MTRKAVGDLYMAEEKKSGIEQCIDYSMLKVFFDKSPYGVLVIDNRSIAYVNKNLTEHFDIRPETVIGQDIQILVDRLQPKDRDSALERLDILSEGQTDTDRNRFKFVGKDGLVHVLDITANSMNFSGKVLVVAHTIEVTANEISRETLARERKAYGIITEAALSTENTSRVCQHALEGLISVLGFDLGTIRLFDKEKQTLNLMASVNLEKADATEIVAKEDLNLLAARTARTLQPTIVADVLSENEHPERMAKATRLGIRTLIFWPIIGPENQLMGVINVASRSVKPVSDDDRTFFATVSGMFATILERRKAEEQLKESQEQFIAFADNMPGPVFIKDDQSHILFVNRFMKRGTPTPDDHELTNVDLFRTKRAKELDDEDQKVLARGPIDRVQNRPDNEGNIRTFRSHKFPIFRQGKPPLIGGFSLDITEQVKAEKQSNEARARAEWATDLMSHDLNNMHQGIMVSLELILQNPDINSDVRRLAENALMQVNRSVSLIANVKKFSLVNKGNTIFEKTDPAGSLITAIEILKQSFPTREIIVDTNMVLSQYCIMADELLQDAFYNILHNAVKATSTKVVKLQVNASLTEEGEYLRLDFIDWGEGIADELKGNILTSLDERIGRVSGVGLTLVKYIVDHYRGKIWVEDRVKGNHRDGTRFVVLLPYGC